MNTKNEKWYQNFWLLFVLALPFSAVIIGLSLVYVALSHPDPDIKKSSEGVRFETVRVYEGGAVLRVNKAINEIIVELNQPTDATALQLILEHPTIAAKDELFILKRIDEKTFKAIAPMGMGKKYITLLSVEQGWKLKSHAVIEKNSLLTLEMA